MQNRYTADIGDFAKYSLLRALSTGRKLGVAWYLYPDESHNEDGKFTHYLAAPERWRSLDPDLFDILKSIVEGRQRDIRKIEMSGLLGDCAFSNRLLSFSTAQGPPARQRADWFQSVLSDLKGCDLVFADPDNGLRDDRSYQIGKPVMWKSIPLSEALVLSAGRTGILYHHNTRRAGGHVAEIQHWLVQLGPDAMALYWKRVSPRTFFIVHPTPDMADRAARFAERWSPHFELHRRQDKQPTPKPLSRDVKRTSDATMSPQKSCPECGHVFNGPGWAGIDAHWKAQHDGIMPYEEAWPIIRSGGKPSAEAR